MRGWTSASASASAAASAADNLSDSSSRGSAGPYTHAHLQAHPAARARSPGHEDSAFAHPSCAGAGMADLLDMPSCTPFALFSREPASAKVVA